MDKDLRDAYKALTLVRRDLVATRRENAALDARGTQQREQLRVLQETQRLRDEDWRARLVAADVARHQLLRKNELLQQELSTLRSAFGHGGKTPLTTPQALERERHGNNQLSTDGEEEEEEEEEDAKRVHERERQPEEEEEEQDEGEEHHDDNNNHRGDDRQASTNKEDDSEDEALVRERLGLLANLYELKVRLQQQTDALVEREALFAQARDEWALQQETLQHQLTQLQVTLLEVNSEKQFMEEKFEFLRTEVDVVRQERDALQRQLAETRATDVETTASTEAADERRASVLTTLREQLQTLRFELLATRAQLQSHTEQWQTERSHVDESLRHELSRFVAGLQQDASVELKSSEAKRVQLETALETLQRQLEATRLALDEAQQQSSEQADNAVELQELRREIEELTSRLFDRDAEVERLVDREMTQTELLAQLRKELVDAEARLTEVLHREALLENALTQLRRQAAADETRNQELTRELQLRDDELTRFRQEMQELTLAMNDEVASVKASLSDGDEKQRRLQAELSDVTQRKDALKLELADATRELALQEAAVVELQRELVERDHESVRRGHELTLLRGRVEELETHLSRRSEELEHVRSQISETLVREERQSEELMVLRRDLAQRDDQHKKREQTLCERDDTIEKLRKELDCQRAEWDEQLALRDDAMNGLRAVHREEMETAAMQHDDEMEMLLQRMESYVKASECQLMALHDDRVCGSADDDELLSDRLPPRFCGLGCRRRSARSANSSRNCSFTLGVYRPHSVSVPTTP
ncbi:hypothetical protein PINS_up010296 [Pythium insidiosum]|nr:hypothetical protein PINS_up010296 [Pythium insidiosum]